MIDQVVDRLYRRLGARYLDLLIAVCLATVMALTALHVAVGVLYMRASATVFLKLVGLGELAMLIAAAVWVPLVRHRLVPLRRWAAGDRAPDDAPAVWRTAVLDPKQFVLIVASIVAVASVPVEALVPSIAHRSWEIGLVAGLYITLAVACGAVWVFFIMETMLDPIAGEIAHAPSTLPAGQPRGVSMSVKLLVFTPVISFYVAALATGLVRDSLGFYGRVAVGVGSALTLALTLSLIGTLLMRRSLLRPVDDLVEAATQVGAGDLDVVVPPRAEDELGQLTHRFNRMVEDLRRQRDELRSAQARIVSSADAARRQIERDLHDGAQQRLVLLDLKLSLAERLRETDPSAANTALAELRDDLKQALRELRDLAHGIYPAVLENEGLQAALGEAAAGSPIPTRVESDGAGRYPAELEAAIYFCCLEALQNAAKHAGGGARATIRLSQRDSVLRFTVADNGAGFDTTKAQTNAGLQNMSDRIGALGGNLTVDSKPGAGVTVTGTIPLRSTQRRPRRHSAFSRNQRR